MAAGRVISQTTFDDAVADTADLLGLDRPAAAAEVVAQFRASGVTDWAGLDVSGASGAEGGEERGGAVQPGSGRGATGVDTAGGGDNDAAGSNGGGGGPRGRGGVPLHPPPRRRRLPTWLPSPPRRRPPVGSGAPWPPPRRR